MTFAAACRALGERDIPVLYADAALLVLDKPAGLLSVPGRGPDKQDCLSTRVQQHCPDALIVHRLDMATSGLIVMARGTAAQRTLSLAFASRSVGKRYVAVVDGQLAAPEPAPGVIDLPIIVDWPRRPLRIIDLERGQPSLTRWRVLLDNPSRLGLTEDSGPHPLPHHHAPAPSTTRLELEPVTGRSHQLRVHLQAIGHPILGDQLYASPAVQARASRLLLHACALTLPHPVSAELLSFESLPPF
jgi:tRNA pseudouridine32 synthase/23S rRNA pseudouridine746 synthase